VKRFEHRPPPPAISSNRVRITNCLSQYFLQKLACTWPRGPGLPDTYTSRSPEIFPRVGRTARTRRCCSSRLRFCRMGYHLHPRRGLLQLLRKHRDNSTLRRASGAILDDNSNQCCATNIRQRITINRSNAITSNGKICSLSVQPLTAKFATV